MYPPPHMTGSILLLIWHARILFLICHARILLLYCPDHLFDLMTDLLTDALKAL